MVLSSLPPSITSPPLPWRSFPVDSGWMSYFIWQQQNLCMPFLLGPSPSQHPDQSLEFWFLSRSQFLQNQLTPSLNIVHSLQDKLQLVSFTVFWSHLPSLLVPPNAGEIPAWSPPSLHAFARSAAPTPASPAPPAHQLLRSHRHHEVLADVPAPQNTVHAHFCLQHPLPKNVSQSVAISCFIPHFLSRFSTFERQVHMFSGTSLTFSSETDMKQIPEMFIVEDQVEDLAVAAALKEDRLW